MGCLVHSVRVATRRRRRRETRPPHRRRPPLLRSFPFPVSLCTLQLHPCTQREISSSSGKLLFGESVVFCSSSSSFVSCLFRPFARPLSSRFALRFFAFDIVVVVVALCYLFFFHSSSVGRVHVFVQLLNDTAVLLWCCVFILRGWVSRCVCMSVVYVTPSSYLLATLCVY